MLEYGSGTQADWNLCIPGDYSTATGIAIQMPTNNASP